MAPSLERPDQPSGETDEPQIASEEGDTAEINLSDDENEQQRKRRRTEGVPVPGPVAKANQDGYLDGSIVRVSLKNFVTYDAVEVRPGPHLNMIIGPNGTGKSTVVCAMALGLGGSTSLLGRAKEISDFIKHGHEEATIEIELKQGNQNCTIKRLIKKSNTSVWSLNGRTCSQKEVVAAVNKLSIQVDNLCQFLPQDKVCEFARMNPCELLRETQKAAGERELSAQHQRLIELRNEYQLVNSTANTERDQKRVLEERNATSEREVRRFEEREIIEAECTLLENSLPWVLYKESRLAYDNAKVAKRTAIEEHARLAKENEPMEAIQKELDQKKRDLEKEKVQSSNNYNAKTRSLTAEAAVLENLENDASECRRSLTQVKREHKARENRIIKTKQEIAQLEEEIQNEPPEFDATPFRIRSEECSRQMRETANEVRSLQDRQRELLDEGREINPQIRERQKQLAQIMDIRERRLREINEQDTTRAVQWLRNNGNLFRQHVYEPIGLEISIRHPQFTDAIETSISRASLKCFVAQNREDYALITSELIDKQRLRINVVQNSNQSYANMRPRVPLERAQQFGFHDYLINYIDAPEPVLLALCLRDNLHNIPFAMGSVQNTAIEETRQFVGYISNNTKYNIRYSRYGQKFSSTRTERLRSGRFFQGSENAEERTRIEGEIQTLQEQSAMLQENVQKLKQEEHQFRQTDEELRKVKQQILAEKRVFEKARLELEAKKLRLGSRNEQLRRELAAPSLADREAEIQERLRDLALKRSKAAQKFQRTVLDNVDIFRERTLIQLKLIQATVDHQAYTTACKEYDSKIRESYQRAKDATNDAARCKADAEGKLEQALRTTDGLGPEEKNKVNENVKQYTKVQLEDRIDSVRARLQATGEVDRSVLNTYHQRKKEIATATSRLAELDERLKKLTDDITVIRNEWYPKLKQLVARISKGFSKAFERIHCAGEVKLKEDEDYSLWGIDILVKFRDHERLNALTGTRQSGGERSVSTILYLMALQELARAPFRVVDEINQGMDPRNERLIHGQLVETACQPNTSQYFLITPKLLPDLTYHERMKVLCIYAGEWQPYTFDVKEYVRKKRSS